MPNLAFRATVAGAVLAAAGLAGCGGSPAGQGHASAAGVDSEWVANATGVIDQLSGDVSSAQPARPGLAGARRSLADLSQLYGMLVAYTDFGGCSKMVGGIGRAPPGYAGVLPGLRRACAGFEHGAALFTRATSDHDARALLAAWQAVKASQLRLYRAALAFAAARSASPS